jgi:hypothetical protein
MNDIQFTEDDVGKDVVRAGGDQVGIVTTVEAGTARVEPDPGLTTMIKTRLGWEDETESTYPLQEAAIDTVTDDEIRLRDDF